MTDLSHQLAQENLLRLAEHPYPGRGFVLGLNSSGRITIVYFLMGRSAGSRNRILVEEPDGSVRTAAADPSKEVGDTSLTLYNAIRESDSFHVVSNGEQTDAILRVMTQTNTRFQDALSSYEYEPDAPNYTPRISGMYDCAMEPEVLISVLRKSKFSDECDRIFFELTKPEPGIGYCVHTYANSRAHPLAPWRGEPFLVPLVGNADQIAHSIWSVLNVDNRVAIAVKVIDRDGTRCQTSVINAYERVAA